MIGYYLLVIAEENGAYTSSFPRRVFMFLRSPAFLSILILPSILFNTLLCSIQNGEQGGNSIQYFNSRFLSLR